MIPNLTLQQVVEGSHVNNLAKVIVEFLLFYGGLLKFNLAVKLICFGTNGVMMFKGSKTKVIV